MKQKITAANTRAPKAANKLNMNKAYLSLGSNIEDRENYLKVALSELSQLGTITQKSNIYDTSPVGYAAQENFLNMCVELQTELSPTDLIIQLQEIEHKMGRVKNIVDGPRKIDLDILLYNNEVIESKNLIIPHPGMHKRKFVLKPLNEIAPDLNHPMLNKAISSLLKKLNNSEQVNIWISKK